jgi:integrase
VPTQRSNRVYYTKRSFPPIGLVYKSLGTKNKTRATALEQYLISLHKQGYVHLIRAFADGKVSIGEIAEHYESSRIHQLVGQLKRPAVPLSEGVEAALRAKAADVKPNTLSRYEAAAQHFLTFAGEKTPVHAALTTDLVQEFKATRVAEGAAQETVNNDLQGVSVVVTYALRQGWIDERPQVKRFKTKVRIKYLEADRINLYMASLRAPFRPLFQLLIGTGMRLGEGESLRVCDLMFGSDGTRALVADSKTAAGIRHVFVPEWVGEALRRHVEEAGLSGTDLLFQIPRRTIQKEHKRACRIAGIPEYTIHDHRHTAAVHLAKAGMPLNLLQQQLGHTRIDMTMRYAHFHPDYSDVRTYFERVESSLGIGTAGNSLGNTPEPAADGRQLRAL